jgi:hypothetical protein
MDIQVHDVGLDMEVERPPIGPVGEQRSSLRTSKVDPHVAVVVLNAHPSEERSRGRWLVVQHLHGECAVVESLNHRPAVTALIVAKADPAGDMPLDSLGR